MKRPFLETLVLWLVLILSVWNGLKTWTALAWKDVLLEHSVQMPPALSAASGGLWFIIGVALTWGVWQRKPWTVKWLPIAAIVYTFWLWSIRLVWLNLHPNAPFVIAENTACLVLVYFASKSLSREAYERNTEDQAVE